MSGKGGKRDDSYFAAGRRRRNRALMVIVPAVAAAVIAAVVAGFAFAKPANSFGPLGSAHEHAVFAVKLDGQAVDFSQSKYQVKSRYIHVEGNDGTTLHRHATGVPFGEFLKSVGMDIQNDCFVRDDGARFCDGDGGKGLKFFVNSRAADSVAGYVLNEEDRILVIYGSETDAQIAQELQVLRDTPIKK